VCSKTFGLGLGELCGLRFDRRVEVLIESAPEIALIIRPLLTSWRQLREQIAVFDKAVLRQVRTNPTCRLLMSVPGVGALTSLAYVSTIEDPGRFSRSRAVGAHLGLTPRQYQSGEVDRRGRISRCGDALVRTLLYEAAVTLLCRVKQHLALKDWALAVARRSGPAKARVALARKLSVLLHAIWRTGQPFRWSPPATVAEPSAA
jgi:transposase